MGRSPPTAPTAGRAPIRSRETCTEEAGGGGGIVQFLSSTPPVIGGAANVNVAAGAKGLANVSGTPTTLVQAGGGGGASGGIGGSGTSSTSGSGAAEAGAQGQIIKTVTSQPELLFY